MPRRDESKIAENLRQTQNAKNRKYAIVHFTKGLRRADRFQPAWDAIGGASGLASTMAEFSVSELRELCKRLGHTTSALQVRPQRRAALDELVTILYEGREDDRPLSRYYQDILPACSIELVQRFEKEKNIEWTPSQGKHLFFGHREHYEANFLDEIFSESTQLTLYEQRRVFRGNVAFIEKILTRLLLFPHDDKIYIPYDLIKEVVMPLLKRLNKSKYDEDTRNRYLDLVLRCVQRHKTQLTRQLSLKRGGLLQYAVDRWGDAPKGSESKKKMEAYLVQAIELSTIVKKPYGFQSARETVCVSPRLSHEKRYDFFRLLLLHTNQYQMDIESGSEQDIARLKRFSHQAWPSHLFFCMDHKRSLRLFEKLDKLFPRNEFLVASDSGGTILVQTQGHIKDSSFGDVEILRALLIRKSKSQNEHPGWYERTRELINERKTNAQQSREAVERAYWAKSTLHLCVAFGDLETLKNTVIWSRRFIRDPLTSSALFREQVFKTREIEELLGAIPDGDVDSPEAVLSFTATLVRKDIELANQILINIVETVTVAIGEPGFRPGDWTWLFHLVKSVAYHRMSWLDVFFKNLTKCSKSDREQCERELMETVWKPTTDVLIQAGATVRYPILEAMRGTSFFNTLISLSNGNSMKGIYVYEILSKTPLSAPLLAELARFLIDQMRARLGFEAMKVQMSSIVSIVNRLATSDQPSLACPFIRDLVLGDEGAEENSSWHRDLLSRGFLSVLPAKAAKEVLYTMASAIKEKMREQNQNTDSREKADITIGGTEEGASKESIKNQGPSIKVTTVKMLAQILEHNLFMGPSSSCDILTGLLAEARHIDIRITITNSLFAIMEDPTCPSALRKRVLDAIEEYIVPAVAQLNERRGLTESDWAEAATSNASLPSIGGETPLYQLLTQKLHGNLNKEDKARLAQLIMGSLEQSAANNARWMKLFLSKNNFSLDKNEELPHLPVHIKLFPELFLWHMRCIPTSVFNMIRSACLINIDPSPGIKRITRTIREDRDLVNSKAGKHWLYQFGENGNDSLKFSVSQAAQTLHQRPAVWESKLAENGITVQILQSFVIEVAEILLKIGKPEIVDKLVESLRLGYLQDREIWNYWHENSIPTIKQIISKTEELQVRIQNKEAEPRLLPSVYQLSLSTLPTPLADSTAAEKDVYVREVYKFVITLADRQNRPYHVDFEKLKEEFNYWSSAALPLALCALRLAEVQAYDLKSTQQPTLTDYLCWELVGHMLANASDPKDDHVAQAVAQLVKDWENCEDGAMRAMGIMFKKKSQYSTERFWEQEE
jgi:hypothetical protein